MSINLSKKSPMKIWIWSNILYVIIAIISKILHSSNFQTGVLMLFPMFGSHICNFRQNISMLLLWIFNVGFCYFQSYVYKLKLLLLLNGPPSVTLELINSLFKDVRSLEIILYFLCQKVLITYTTTKFENVFNINIEHVTKLLNETRQNV